MMLSTLWFVGSIVLNSVIASHKSTIKTINSKEVKSVAWPTTGNPNVLVTGGAGYIGTHTIVTLIEAGYDVTVVDNLVNANVESLKRVCEITGCDSSRLRFYHVDLCDEDALEAVFKDSKTFCSCIHFAGLKAVGESVAKPILYYENNLGSTSNLIKMLDKYDCHKIVFSSSATVYGSAAVPITESTPAGVGITNAYGRTKYMIEEILKDFKGSKVQHITKKPDDWSVVILRYFNPVGAHPSGRIGEDPNGIPNNLMPYVAQVVVGRREKLTVFGNDYDTKDGTGVRDYIHVMDLAEGHAAALKFMDKKGPSYDVFNLGTGNGNSVLEMVAAMKKASGKSLPYEFGSRRPGDIAVCYAATDKAEKELGWKATRSLDDMCKDLWAWQSTNPNGYN
jgi:UDP-glucose 4-epimerase